MRGPEGLKSWGSGRLRGALALVAVAAATGCTRYAEVPPTEVPKLNGAAAPVEVRTVEGHGVVIDPDYRFVGISQKDASGRTERYRPPVAAFVYGDALCLRGEPPEEPACYPLESIDSVLIAQHDTSRAAPLFIAMGVGAFVGIVVGAALGQGDCPSRYEGDAGLCIGRGAGAVLGGVGGTMLGAVVGIPFTITLKYY
jgi:hypothetical protein